mmetsp:Transcript_65873/g.189971  ORF Transcript_65873/g.189971 Transcript_65873/m.189971 type:complete len:210 (+) Transcript_65873:2884-3513(+)
MGVRAADTQGAHRGDRAAPVACIIDQPQLCLLPRDHLAWVACVERRDLALVEQHQRRLHEAWDAGNGVRVADVALHRAEADLSVRGERLFQGLHLERVAQLRARAVALHVVHVSSGEACVGQGGPDHLHLALETRRAVARFAVPIVVRGRAADCCVHAQVLLLCCVQPCQDEQPSPIGVHGAICTLRIGPADAVLGPDHAVDLPHGLVW